MGAVRTVTRKVARITVNLVALVVLGLAAVMLVPGLAGFERYVITGGSMSGTFERGALVFEKETPVTELAVGDVITYLPPAESGITELVTHRILSIEATDTGPVFRTQGDANADPDPWTFQLTGPTQARLEGFVPHLGWVFIALSDPQIRQLLIGGPAAVVALFYLADLVGALRSPRRTKQQRGATPPLPVGTSVA